MDFLSKTYFNHTGLDYLLAILILISAYALRKIFTYLFTTLLFKVFHKYCAGVGQNKLTELLQKPFSVLVFLVSLYFAMAELNYPASWNTSLAKTSLPTIIFISCFKIALLASLIMMAVNLTEYVGLLLLYRAQNTASKTDDMLVPFIKESLKIIFIVLGVFVLLSKVFHVHLTAILGGAGIAGLAIALAAQETLGNLLGSFTIFLDKPFVVGDLVRIGAIHGRIEHIGFRSTRIRTLEKSYVTIPNKKMVDAELDNLTERTLYRVQFKLDFKYNSNPDSIRAFNIEIKNYLLNNPNIDENVSVYLHEMTSSALQVIIIYFVKTNDWEEHIVVKEATIYNILETAKTLQLELAFPSSSIYIESANN
ncbi:MAG TPA: mechanosensitive ion channel family protein, partial [Bacteroidia bacterium]|nr:mechanosensitive ion channel family protein [Bacteroidia bacterium]